MKQTLLFGRPGNKENDIKYFKHLLPLDSSIIVEPFGGSFAVCRKIYNDEKYNKFVNDNDDVLTEIYNKPEEYLNLNIKLTNKALNHLNQKNHVIYKQFIQDVNNDDTIDKNSIMFKYWVDTKIFKSSTVSITKNINCTEQINLMKQINFSNVDYTKTIDKFKHNENTFIFIDPPYLFSDNSNYMQQKRKDGADITDIFIYLLNLLKSKKTKAKIMIIINDMKVLRWLFKKYVKLDYEKKYSVSGRKEKLLVITNYN